MTPISGFRLKDILPAKFPNSVFTRATGTLNMDLTSLVIRLMEAALYLILTHTLREISNLRASDITDSSNSLIAMFYL